MGRRSIILSILIHLVILGAIAYFYERLEDKKADLTNTPMTAQIITREPVPVIRKQTPQIVPKKPISPAPYNQQPQIAHQKESPVLNKPVISPEPNEHVVNLPPSPPSVSEQKSTKPPPIKGDIFDTDIIERHAMKGSSAPDSGNIVMPDFEDTRHGGVTFQVDNMKYFGYLQRLKETIQGKWEYPEMDQRRGIFGDLIVEFTINKDGTLAAAHLIRTSGHRSLDEAALDSIRNAAPYWPLPDDWHAKTFTIKGHFVYILDMMRRY
ncbi:MAG: energy transducer TonB [Nitrospirae bacterium]|nr:energy transducer TonB [Nitrospirota bacterium]